MRWYVSRNGETVGPVDEGTIVVWVRGGMTDAQIQPETGGPWRHVMQAEFARSASAKRNPFPIWVMALVCVGIVAIAALVIAAGVASHNRGVESRAIEAARADEARERVSKPDKAAAWAMAQQFVRQSLKSPSSADFGSVLGESQSPNRTVAEIGENKFRVRGWVDADNAFGAKLRNNFVVDLEYLPSSKEWQATSGPTLTPH